MAHRNSFFDDRSLSARVGSTIDRAIADDRIVGCVVSIAVNGNVIYERAAGFSDREQSKAMTVESIFRLASVTKPVISLAALRLCEEGVLSVSDPVTRWLPFFTPNLADGSCPDISVHQLLTHTAGLGYRFNQPPGGSYDILKISDGLDRVDFDLEENLRRLALAPLVFQPGSSWCYSLATDVLGAVIERALDVPLPRAIAEIVCEPLELETLSFRARRGSDIVQQYVNGACGTTPMTGPKFAVLPDGDGNGIMFDPSRAFDLEVFPSGGAGMVGTSRDLLTIFEHIRDGSKGFLGEKTLSLLGYPHVGATAKTQGPGWGFGYCGAVLLDPKAACSPQSVGTLQWGGVYGHRWFIDKLKGLTAIVLTNTTWEGVSGLFPQEIRDAVYGAPSHVLHS
jgi:CubicO group peptidase (beta-lactamase class C family)